VKWSPETFALVWRTWHAIDEGWGRGRAFEELVEHVQREERERIAAELDAAEYAGDTPGRFVRELS
jgi:hypothetical protein